MRTEQKWYQRQTIFFGDLHLLKLWKNGAFKYKNDGGSSGGLPTTITPFPPVLAPSLLLLPLSFTTFLHRFSSLLSTLGERSLAPLLACFTEQREALW